MKISKHATKRMQQRCFSENDIDLIIEHGEQILRPRGVIEYRITSRVKQKIEMDLKRQLNMLCRIANKSIIMDEADGTMITAFHTYKA